jgi:putative hydrolases of HD superfamily
MMKIQQKSPTRYTICNDCAFHIQKKETIKCTHPDEQGVNCTIVYFCSSFQPSQQIDSPCVCFGNHE